MVRSPIEIIFRLRQEIANFYFFVFPPDVSIPAVEAPLAGLPDPAPVIARLRGSDYAGEIQRLARLIHDHRFPLFESEVATGPHIDWTRDYRNSISSSARAYFRRVPYLDFGCVGDHKNVWELSRHQHLIVLAQAALFERNPEYVLEIESQLTSWWNHNEFQCGMNWASALEVAFRALSWIWVYHLVGDQLESSLRSRLLTELYRHGLHLEYNLSVYFSPNTHLLGEAAALHALGVLFPQMPRAAKWRQLGGDTVRAQMDFQVFDDGSHFEQSTYYHLYAVDFFLLHHLLEPAPAEFQAKLRRMVDYLNAFVGPAQTLPLIGDDDGGRLFHPYGPRQEFARATLATCAAVFPGGGWQFDPRELPVQAAWWVGERALDTTAISKKQPAVSQLFTGSGLAVMSSLTTSGTAVHILADAGPFGYAGAGHSHADTLSIVAWRNGEEILIDPASYTYIASPEWRNRFRGTAAHNTICVDGAGQAIPAGPFRWQTKPTVERQAWITTDEADFLDAICYSQFVHRRRIAFLKSFHLVFVLDDIDSLARSPGVHTVEQYWHLGDAAAESRFTCSGGNRLVEQGGEIAWRSRVLGDKHPAPVFRVRHEGPLPTAMATAIDFSDSPGEACLKLENSGDQRVLSWRKTDTAGTTVELSLTLSENSAPVWTV